MFFTHLRTFESLAITLAVFAAACLAIWSVRKRRNLLRIPVIALSSPIVLLTALFVGLQVLFLGCESNSVSLFSPGHQKLVRTVTDDGGALGGSTAVELLTHHGFSSTYIYRGGWASVDLAKDIRWLDDSHIVIQYEPYEFHDCTSTASVNVRCSKKQRPVPTGTLAAPDGNAVAELHTAKDGTYQGTDAVVLTGHIGDAFVYVGDPGSVVWAKTRWLNNRELEISTKAPPKACGDQIGVAVHCVPFAGR